MDYASYSHILKQYILTTNTFEHFGVSQVIVTVIAIKYKIYLLRNQKIVLNQMENWPPNFPWGNLGRRSIQTLIKVTQTGYSAAGIGLSVLTLSSKLSIIISVSSSCSRGRKAHYLPSHDCHLVVTMATAAVQRWDSTVKKGNGVKINSSLEFI